MTKLITMLMFGLLLMNLQCTFAKQKDTLAQPSNTVTVETDENFNFDENSYNVSDEQTTEATEADTPEEKTDFDTKVINSSHFSSGTATRTWIPFNRFK